MVLVRVVMSGDCGGVMSGDLRWCMVASGGLGERRGGGARGGGRGAGRRLISEWTVDQGGVCKYTSCIIYRRQKGFMCWRRCRITVLLCWQWMEKLSWVLGGCL